MNAPFLTPSRPAVSGAITALAYAAAEHARSVGLAVVYIRASKLPGSPTKHLMLRDRQRREWQLRVSDRRAPEHTGYDRPHFELTTIDGLLGAETLFCFINQVSRGEIAWTEPVRTRKRKGQRCRGQR